MRRVWLGIGLLSVALTLLVGGVVGAARAAQTAYACVRLFEAEGDNERVFDLNTGLATTSRASRASLRPQPPAASWPSPDGQWLAYARPATPLASQLYTIFAAAGPAVPTADDSATLLATTNGVFDLGWSPDSQRLALLWRDEAGTIYLTTVVPDGSRRIDRQVPSGPVNDVRLHGWSADGRYLATSAGAMSAGGESLQVWRADDGSTVAPGMPPADLPLIEYASWSPVGARFAYLRGDARSTQARLFIIAPDDHPAEVQVSLPAHAVGWRLKWSPDGARLALSFFEDPDLRIAVYDLRGGTFVQTGNAVIGTRLIWPVSFDWSADSRAVIFWSDRLRTRDLAAYDVDDGRIDLLVGDAWTGPRDPLAADPNPNGGTRRVVVAFRTDDGTYAADIMDVDGANRARLFFNARTASDAIWSPDGEITLIRWTTQDGLLVQPWLTWARRDGSDLHHLQDVEGEYVDVLWLPGGRRLAYILSEHGRLAVEVLDLEHNTRFQLVRGLDAVRGLAYDAASGQLRFWWRNGRGESGTDAFAYDPDRTWMRVYRFRVPGGLEGDYRLERAPSGPYALLIPLGGSGQGPTFLASDDGMWSHPLDASAKYVTQVGWSPDGARLALVLDSLVVRVFDAQGTALSHAPLLGPFDGAPTLTRCD